MIIKTKKLLAMQMWHSHADTTETKTVIKSKVHLQS